MNLGVLRVSCVQSVSGDFSKSRFLVCVLVCKKDAVHTLASGHRLFVVVLPTGLAMDGQMQD